MKLKELKYPYFAKDKKYNFLLPIGATEQHGRFLPLGTDTYITDYLIDQISLEFPNMIMLPSLEYSRSQEHKGFSGTIWLTEETLDKVMFDICNSLKDNAKNIFITSFHANDPYIDKFISKDLFANVSIINIKICHKEDDKYIEKSLLSGPIDEHAGNTEISNMLEIDESLVTIPSRSHPKEHISDPWSTDNLIEKCPTGIADNHPKWIINRKIGKEILDIYVKRMVIRIKKHI